MSQKPHLNADLARAARLFESGDLRRAEQAAKAAQASAPAAASQILAGIALKRGELEIARIHAATAVEASPGSARLRLNLGTIEFALKRADEALETFRSAAALAPRDFEAQLGYGKMLAELGRLEEAVAQFQRAHAIAPHPRAKGPMADALFRLERYSEAENWAKAAQAAGLDTAELNCLIGKIHLEQRRFERSIAAFNAALEKNPTETDALMGLSVARGRINDVIAAREATKRYLELRPVIRVGAATPEAHVAVAHPLFDGSFRTAKYGSQLPAGGNYSATLRSDRLQFQHVFVPLSDGFVAQQPDPRADLVLSNIVNAEMLVDPLRGRLAADALASFGAPVVNALDAVFQCSREENARRFADAAGFRFPKTAVISRRARAAGDIADEILAQVPLPLILRPPHTQRGGGAKLVRSCEELAEMIPSFRAETITAIEFIDCSDAEGVSRKYRMACVGGELIPAHLDAGRGWMVHGRSRDDFDWLNSPFAVEERAFLADPAAALGAAPEAIFAEIVSRTPLDIYGFDFGRSRSGELIVFEANASMALTTESEVAAFPYMKPYRDRLFGRIETFLLDRALDARRAA